MAIYQRKGYSEHEINKNYAVRDTYCVTRCRSSTTREWGLYFQDIPFCAFRNNYSFFPYCINTCHFSRGHHWTCRLFPKELRTFFTKYPGGRKRAVGSSQERNLQTPSSLTSRSASSNE